MKRSLLVIPALAVALCLQPFVQAESGNDENDQEQQSVTVPEKRKYPHFGSKQEKIEWLRYEIERLKAERNYDTQEIERQQNDLNAVEKQLKQLRQLRHENKVQIFLTVDSIQKSAGVAKE